MKKTLIVVLLVVAAFATGFGYSYYQSMATADALAKLQSESAVLQDALALAKLRNQLALMIIDVSKGNFGDAKNHATPFFDAVRELAAKTADNAAKQKLNAALNHRDQVISDLTALNPGVAATLQTIFLDLAPAP
jgi:type II secretory pathway pseudopilin PulG